MLVSGEIEEKFTSPTILRQSSGEFKMLFKRRTRLSRDSLRKFLLFTLCRLEDVEGVDEGRAWGRLFDDDDDDDEDFTATLAESGNDSVGTSEDVSAS